MKLSPTADHIARRLKAKVEPALRLGGAARPGRSTYGVGALDEAAGHAYRYGQAAAPGALSMISASPLRLESIEERATRIDTELLRIVREAQRTRARIRARAEVWRRLRVQPSTNFFGLR